MPTSRAKDDPAAFEEERRLMYVAITRARKLLYLTRSTSRYLYGHREPTVPSPFIKDLQGTYECKQGEESYVRRTSYGGQTRSYYGGSGGYGSGYGRRSSYGGDGYEGDYWQSTPTRGRSIYSSDEGYSPDPAPSFSSPSSASSATAHFSAASSFGGSSAKPASGAKTYTVGCKVRHPKFGVGTVIALKNGGKVVDIAFENQGIKELSASIAPLEILR